MPQSVLSEIAAPGAVVTRDQISTLVAAACPAGAYRDKKILLIVPDATRTAPVDLFFQALHAQMAAETRAFDVMRATHQPRMEQPSGARVDRHHSCR
ncbi:MAG: hypothetical protein WCH43_09910 [Verrucomicrobiota bacterium]